MLRIATLIRHLVRCFDVHFFLFYTIQENLREICKKNVAFSYRSLLLVTSKKLPGPFHDSFLQILFYDIRSFDDKKLTILDGNVAVITKNIDCNYVVKTIVGVYRIRCA